MYDGIMFIYLITNLANRKVYVGQTKRPIHRRWKQHVSCAKLGKLSRLSSAIRKYGSESFRIEELDQYPTKEELSVAEIIAIAIYQSTDRRFGYNLGRGGEGAPEGNKHRLGKSHRLDSRVKMSKSHVALKLGPASPEHKRKIQISMRGKQNCKGRVLSRLTRDKIRASEKGKFVSEETRNKQRLARLGKSPWNKGLKFKQGEDDAEA